MAASLKAVTAEAIWPTSSLRPMAGTMIVVSPPARRRMAEVIDSSGLPSRLVSRKAMAAAMIRARITPPISTMRADLATWTWTSPKTRPCSVFSVISEPRASSAGLMYLSAAPSRPTMATAWA
ncbi:hypothetical protein D3C85_541540 [compost metagenome]